MPKRGETLNWQVRYWNDLNTEMDAKRSFATPWGAKICFEWAVRARQLRTPAGDRSHVRLIRKDDGAELAAWDGPGDQQLDVSDELVIALGDPYSISGERPFGELMRDAGDEAVILHTQAGPAEPASAFSVSADGKVHQYDPDRPGAGWQRVIPELERLGLIKTDALPPSPQSLEAFKQRQVKSTRARHIEQITAHIGRIRIELDAIERDIEQGNSPCHRSLISPAAEIQARIEAIQAIHEIDSIYQVKDS